jgi:hypothetical protein
MEEKLNDYSGFLTKVREHSGYIREHAGIIRGTFSEHSVNIH